MKKFAVFGNPIKQSISPQIHLHFAQQAGMTIEYEKRLSSKETFNADLDEFFQNENVVGCNITAPFKEQAFAYSTLQHGSAKDALASNTLHKVNGQIEAHNTDGAGLVKDIKRIVGSLDGANVLLLGAGGAARGVIRPLLAEHISQLTIANRTVAKAEELVALSGGSNVSGISLATLSGNFDIVINSTSASLTNELPDLGALTFDQTTLTYDMSYKAKPTAFLELAKGEGSKECADGLGMLIGQAAVAFMLWTGFEPTTDNLLTQLRTNMFA